MEKTREVQFTETEFKTLQALAKQHGYVSIRHYLLALIEHDAEQRDEPPPAIEDDNDLGDPVENFREAWAQVQRGELLTEEEFWKAIADDD